MRRQSALSATLLSLLSVSMASTSFAAWKVTTSTDPMEGTAITMAHVRASSPITDPADIAQYVTLGVRCSRDRQQPGDLDVLLVFSNSTLVSYDGADLKWRVDDGAVHSETWRPSRSEEAAFSPRPREILGPLKSSSVFHLQLFPPLGRSVYTTFSLAGSSRSIAAVETACEIPPEEQLEILWAKLGRLADTYQGYKEESLLSQIIDLDKRPGLDALQKRLRVAVEAGQAERVEILRRLYEEKELLEAATFLQALAEDLRPSLNGSIECGDSGATRLLARTFLALVPEDEQATSIRGTDLQQAVDQAHKAAADLDKDAIDSIWREYRSFWGYDLARAEEQEAHRQFREAEAAAKEAERAALEAEATENRRKCDYFRTFKLTPLSDLMKACKQQMSHEDCFECLKHQHKWRRE